MSDLSEREIQPGVAAHVRKPSTNKSSTYVLDSCAETNYASRWRIQTS